MGVVWYARPYPPPKCWREINQTKPIRPMFGADTLARTGPRHYHILGADMDVRTRGRRGRRNKSKGLFRTPSHTYIHTYIHIQAYRHTVIHTYIHTDRHTYMQPDGQPDTDRHTDIHTYAGIHRYINTYIQADRQTHIHT